jgi:gliding motility-associated-like protein
MMQRCFLYVLLFVCCRSHAQQNCPPNLGFENGDFDHWDLFSGYIDASGNISVSPTSQTGSKHVMLRRVASGAPEYDIYGNFPVNSPNGSLYSIRLGNAFTGREVDQLQYTFSVPANSAGYSFIFNYAVVLQSPGHNEYEQPRFQVKLFNVTKNEYVQCGSFDFVAGFSQPDFVPSRLDNTVLYKPWSSVTLNLTPYAGETLRLEFSVNDCTRGGHFGYAYIDVNSSCTDPVAGAVVCGADTSSTVLQAPVGFSDYLWYSGDMQNFLTRGPTLNLTPVVLGDSFSLVILPFAYLGCQDTMLVRIRGVNEPLNLVVKDSVIGCADRGVDLTSPQVTLGSGSNLTFNYFSNANANQVIPAPTDIRTSGVYYITGTNNAGCIKLKPVLVRIHQNPEFRVVDPPEVTYPVDVDLRSTVTPFNYTYTFWTNPNCTQPLTDPQAVQRTGQYFIQATDTYGCTSVKPVSVKVHPLLMVPTGFTPNGDGKNDVFIYKALGGMERVEYFRIYNRWGQVVFSTTQVDKGWDGKFLGLESESGAYIWMIKAVDCNGRVYEQKGTVMLIR